jgi:hypothetical protein
LSSQLHFAKEGLFDLAIKPEFLNFLEVRLENSISPGEYTAVLWEKKFNESIKETVVEIIAEIWNRTKTNDPIV